ncbi:hypothetical protein [Halomonas getboli]|uniref:hypothetical protein n=1 Tax=Halomonas getboli TaxID=2935862 RepID=UPI001FFF36D6|nr:hypothetical protein [Halomonas getboli]MCK2183304.1 hypothetical protein [Halomonas getboli]
MWKRLFGKPPIRVWVIKQVDADLLHLCGEGRISPDGKRARDEVITALRRGEYRGAVEMIDNGLVLNARLFAALLPDDAFHLDADGLAHWQDQTWRVAKVPQRCWTYEGLLVARAMAHGDFDLVSSEDVSGIRRRAASEGLAASNSLQFGAADELEGEAEFAERWRRRRQTEDQHDDD